MPTTTKRKQLTDEGVRRLRPPKPPGQNVYWDSIVDRLGLFVSYGGSKTWRVLYYVNSKPRSAKLGRYPQMKVKAARNAARKFIEDPDGALARAKVGTFKEVAEDWFQKRVAGRKLVSEGEIRRILDKYVYPKWKDRKFLEIKKRDVNSLLDDIKNDNSAAMADSVLASVISPLMNWYQSEGDDYVSAAIGIKKRHDGNGGRKRYLSDDELRLFWDACDADGVGHYGDYLKIVLLTASRPGKVASMKWSDLKRGEGEDGEAYVEWHIAQDDDREKGTALILRLPQAAAEIIEAQERKAGNPYVFPGSLRGRRRRKVATDEPPHINSHHRKAKIDKAMFAAKREQDPEAEPIERWTPHDLRRTARTLMSRAGVKRHIAERVLGHAIPGVEGIYDQFEYYDEKAEALSRLAGLVEQIVIPPEGDNVIPIGLATLAPIRRR